jgi:PTS system nitrogen regulatory IIA component
MDLRVRDVARLLNVSEPTVYRWVREGGLPAHRVGEHYRFNRVELQEWAALHGHSLPPQLLTPGVEDSASLAAALERGGVHRDVTGATREEVLASVAQLPGIPAGVDRAMLAQLLIGREALASTAAGDGIAMPHPRDPLVVRVDQPRVLLCLLGRPVDFDALDGRPVRILFTMLSRSVREHLRMLATLAFVLHDVALRELLNRAAPNAAILERIRIVEASAGPVGPPRTRIGPAAD